MKQMKSGSLLRVTASYLQIVAKDNDRIVSGTRAVSLTFDNKLDFVLYGAIISLTVSVPAPCGSQQIVAI